MTKIITHDFLIKKARAWVTSSYRNTTAHIDKNPSGRNCSIALCEIVTQVNERPDILAFYGDISTMIECKVSRSDFFADKKKIHRIMEGKKEPLGNRRFYLCPDGVIKTCEIPDNWGLLYLKNNEIKVIKESTYIEKVMTEEILILLSVVKRLNGNSKYFSTKEGLK